MHLFIVLDVIALIVSSSFVFLTSVAIDNNGVPGAHYDGCGGKWVPTPSSAPPVAGAPLLLPPLLLSDNHGWYAARRLNAQSPPNPTSLADASLAMARLMTVGGR
jgi:hypothetical protein